MKEIIRIETALKRNEIDETLIQIIKLKIGIKKTFLFGVLRILEEQAKNEDDTKKRKTIEKHIDEIKKSLGIL